MKLFCIIKIRLTISKECLSQQKIQSYENRKFKDRKKCNWLRSEKFELIPKTLEHAAKIVQLSLPTLNKIKVMAKK